MSFPKWRTEWTDLLPVDNARLDDVVKLEDDQRIGEVRVQPVDVRSYSHRIHPVTVCWG